MFYTNVDQFKAEKAKLEMSYPAQRKVANALLMMVANETMLFHFMHKGGVDALFKLVRESKQHYLIPLLLVVSCPLMSLSSMFVIRIDLTL